MNYWKTVASALLELLEKVAWALFELLENCGLWFWSYWKTVASALLELLENSGLGFVGAT